MAPARRSHYAAAYSAADDSARFLAVYLSSSAREVVLYYGGAAKLRVSWPAHITDGLWHRIMVTVAGTTARLYVDGEQFGSAQTLASLVSFAVRGVLFTGKRAPNHFPFRGLMYQGTALVLPGVAPVSDPSMVDLLALSLPAPVGAGFIVDDQGTFTFDGGLHCGRPGKQHRGRCQAALPLHSPAGALAQSIGFRPS